MQEVGSVCQHDSCWYLILEGCGMILLLVRFIAVVCSSRGEG